MKKKILAFFLGCFLILGAANAQGKMITISEDQLAIIIQDEVSKAIKKAVDAAVLVVVKEYENKILEYKKQIINQDITITNVTAEREIARAEATKFENLYKIEKSRRGNMVLITIGVAGVSALLGYGISFIP